MLLVRDASEADAVAIRNLLKSAFPTAAEADLVDQLGRDGESVISLVAIEDGAVVGQVLFSRMAVEADGRQVCALGLAPIAVAPERQGRGIGSRLIQAGLERARDIGAHLVFVLGEPEYYGRFGFTAAAAEPFASPYAGPYLQAAVLAGGYRTPTAARADYAAAFAGLG